MTATHQDMLQWERKRWPGKDDQSRYYGVLIRAAKLAEESGEVIGAVVKWTEGRRTEQDILDEIGDVLITVNIICAFLGVNPDDVLDARFREVSQR